MPRRQLHNYLLVAVLVASNAYFTFVVPSLVARNVNASVGLALLSGQIAWLLLRQVEPRLRPATRDLGAIFAAFAAVAVARTWVDLTGPHVGDFVGSGPYDAAVILIYQTLFITLTIALFLLVSGRLLTDLEADIAERRIATTALRASQQKFAVAFESVPDAILIVRLADGLVVEANDSCLRTLGYAKEEAVGKTTIELNVWLDIADRHRYLGAMAEHGRVTDFETPLRRKSGETFPAILSGETIEVDGEHCALTVIQDATERKLTEAQLRDLSDHDPLTGLLNLRAFYSVAADRLESVSGSQVALVYLDLDHLKDINDKYGHALGDQALQTFASALQQAFRGSDVVGRLGGDEFAVLAVARECVTDSVLMTRFAEVMAEKNASSGLPFDVSASLGVAWCEPGTGSAELEALIGTADRRMYEVKRAR